MTSPTPQSPALPAEVGAWFCDNDHAINCAINDIYALDDEDTQQWYIDAGNILRKILKYALSTTQPLPPSPQAALGVREEAAWQESGRVMADADKLEELIQLKMERPGITREEALKWALEMRSVYSPAPVPAGGETPRTDKEVLTWTQFPDSPSEMPPCVSAPFARQLERELTALRALLPTIPPTKEGK